jgi:hypothetical protein
MSVLIARKVDTPSGSVLVTRALLSGGKVFVGNDAPIFATIYHGNDYLSNACLSMEIGTWAPGHASSWGLGDVMEPAHK